MVCLFCSYTSGEDTYLLQLRDTDFPARLRQYMKVAASQSPSFALHLQGSYYDRNVSWFWVFGVDLWGVV